MYIQLHLCLWPAPDCPALSFLGREPHKGSKCRWLSAVVFLAAGILGVANSRKVERAGICMIMGILMIAYVVINFGYGALTSGVAVGSIISTVLMLIVPLLYLWGALKNKEVSDGNVSE